MNELKLSRREKRALARIANAQIYPNPKGTRRPSGVSEKVARSLLGKAMVRRMGGPKWGPTPGAWAVARQIKRERSATRGLGLYRL